ncbi:MAG: hypothetical protein H7328_05865 [Bdellovibrio sp.]|nr:hypothetical protein [Bdellovibrio sp.]
MKAKYWIAVLVLVGTVLAIEYDIARRTDAKITAKNRKPAATVAIAAGSVAPAQATSEAVPITFEERFKSETLQIASLQASPGQVEQRLEALALSMTSNDIQSLSKIMQNPARNSDERAMAVEILSLKKTPESLRALEGFVKTHQPTTKENWSRSQEFESVMRAQAVEGIAAYPEKDLALTSLNSLSQQVDESFLLDRIMRSSVSVKGKAAATEQQDDAALKKLIE